MIGLARRLRLFRAAMALGTACCAAPAISLAQQVIIPGGSPVQLNSGAIVQFQASGIGTGPIMPAPSVIPGAIDPSAPLFALSHFDPPVIPAGGRAMYRVIVGNPSGSVQPPAALPAVRGLTFRRGASEQQLVMVEGKVWRIWTFNYHAIPDEAAPNYFLIPSFTMTVEGSLVTVPGGDLHVTAADDPLARRPLQLELQGPDRTVFVGESVPIRVQATSSGEGMLQNLTGLQVSGDALLVFNDSMYARQSKQFRNEGGVMKVTVETDVLVSPLREGSFHVRATAQATVESKEGVPPILAAYRPLIEAEPVVLNAVKVPTNGVLPGYGGAIGLIEIESAELSTNQVRVGEPLTLVATFRGEANLQTVEAPAIPRTPGWQLMPAAPSQTHILPGSLTVSRAFRYTLIPLNDQITNTPAIPFSYFNPQAMIHVDLTVPPQPLVVLPGPTNELAGMPPARWNGREASPESIEPRTLRPLADSRGETARGLIPVQARGWFLWMQLIPGTVIGGLWLWDRRRRYLAAHPEIRAFRRARRAYVRCFAAARSAARAGDVMAYATAVVEAMRELAAPRISANAESLVAADLIALLPSATRDEASRQRIRALFALVDARRFSLNAVESANLLGDQAGTEALLGSLLGELHSWMRHRVYRRATARGRADAQAGLTTRSVPAEATVAVIAIASWMTLAGSAAAALAGGPDDPFRQGISAYVDNDFASAAEAFAKSVADEPSSGGYHNLGNAHWRNGEIGRAILAWERAVWLNPYQRNSRDNLVFARQTTRIDAPSATWFEACSAWLPVNVWAWTAAGSFWIASALLILPATLRWRRAYWHHAGAAVGLALFLLSVPALAGVHSRAQRGVIVSDETPVRLTPTQDGEVLTRLPAGTTARMVRQKGGLYYIRTAGGSSGWVNDAGFELITQGPE